MRLICPNCGAQYEVETTLIPETGRDVQCSNCGHGWFQHPEDHVPDEDPVEADGDGADPAPATTPGRRTLDPSVADVLREEAEREAAARRAEAGGSLESQPDLGLDDSEEKIAARSAAARARMARLRGLEDDKPVKRPESPQRSELLPDVEEINSTLRSNEERGETPALEDLPRPQRKGRGGSLGFFLVLFVCLVAVAVYALAPMIAERLPQAEPWLSSYVTWVNAVRLQVNGWVESGIAAIRGLLGGGA